MKTHFDGGPVDGLELEIPGALPNKYSLALAPVLQPGRPSGSLIGITPGLYVLDEGSQDRIYRWEDQATP